MIEDYSRAHGFLAKRLYVILTTPIDQGDADPFLAEQLRPELLQDACAAAGIDLTLRLQPGYDHSYHFISTFMADHLGWHAERLHA